MPSQHIQNCLIFDISKQTAHAQLTKIWTGLISQLFPSRHISKKVCILGRIHKLHTKQLTTKRRCCYSLNLSPGRKCISNHDMICCNLRKHHVNNVYNTVISPEFLEYCERDKPCKIRWWHGGCSALQSSRWNTYVGKITTTQSSLKIKHFILLLPQNKDNT